MSRKAPTSKQATCAKEALLLPLLPLRDIVLFPRMVVPLLVGRDRSVHAVEAAIFSDDMILVAAQKSVEEENPEPDDIYRVGTQAKIIQILKLPDGSAKVLVEGICRRRIERFLAQKDYYRVKAVPFVVPVRLSARLKALMRTVSDLFQTYLQVNPRLPSEIAPMVSEIDDPERLADTVCAHAAFKIAQKQELIEMPRVDEQLHRLVDLLTQEIEILKIERDITGRVRDQVEKNQRTYYLHERLKAIEEELGREHESGEYAELERRIREAKMPQQAEEKTLAELEKLGRMQPMSPEATVSQNYVEWLVELPWAKETSDKTDIKRAERILNIEHHALDEPKERVLEYLAVRKLARSLTGPILCLVGPPGVGKTSLAKSVAHALGRKFARISLGGMRDEAEIRGHRRTYIGAMPGRIIQALRRCASRNPVILLDEIDKLSSDFRGDPQSALLEVLDPEINTAFNDHYIEVDFDLSKILFIATANTPHTIHPTLLDRMELIRLPGYTDWEKLEIASRFLVPKQVKAHGLAKRTVTIQDETLLRIIRDYTREAGVRNLERELTKILRKLAREVSSNGRRGALKVSAGDLEKYLGAPKYRRECVEGMFKPGVATGLAWTEAGGDILRIETAIMPGKGEITLTGQLGDVMKESARAALTYIRAHEKELALPTGFHKSRDIHVHVPEGQTPKDGPSAGVAIVASVLSALSKRPVRSDTAMTGEITLRGVVLPVGGLKEKSLAAHRCGIKRIIIPSENARDLDEIPPRIKQECSFVPIETVDQLIAEVFEKK
ncbi:MAG: endopeptidase La [Verrucomicrobia bacterium]|nr:endopeptidase La [Verrucomicrobiota bacterium]